MAYSFNGAYLYANNEFQNYSREYVHKELHDCLIPELFELPRKEFYLCAMNIPENHTIIERDFVREQTLELLSKEIRRKNVQGNVVELGVYKGEFSKKINSLFPERTLYLFDTFEGFDQRDTKSETIKWCDRLDPFDSVTVRSVLDTMPYPDKCCVKKGYFPDTYDLDEKFAFVSIDVDLYDPIKKGLEIFYPQLAKGGYIMIHDCFNIAWSGAYDALVEYCDKNNISYVPIPDVCGSVVITK